MPLDDLAAAPEADEAHVLGYDSLGAYTALMFPRFRCADHHAKLIQALERVERGECRRLIVTFPPRHGKSLIISEHFPSWYLGRNPHRYIIATTYAQELANDFGRKVRNQFRDPLYQAVFPGITMSRDSQSATRFNVSGGGAYFAVGRNGSMTGRGAHVLVIDDILKNREEADSPTIREKVRGIYTDAAYTRLMPGGAIVIVMTRWHDDDLAGWVMREHRHESWEKIDFPAIDQEGNALWDDPEVGYPVERLAAIRRTVGERAWNALYLQRPFVEEGAIIQRKWWKPQIGAPTERPDFIILSVDTAYTEAEENDPSACTVWWVMGDQDMRQRVLLRYAWAKRLPFNELLEELRATYRHFGMPGVPCRVLVEAKASGLSVIQELRRTVEGIPVWAIQPKGDKVARAYSVQTLFEMGKVYAMAETKPVPGHPEESETVFRPWAKEVIDQAVGFPRLEHDDLVDSVTQALRHVRDMGVVLSPQDDAPPPTIGRDGRPKGVRTGQRRGLYAPPA